MIHSFQLFELDVERRELSYEKKPIAIPPKVFSVLVYLIERHARMVPKAELLEEFWPSNVSDAALQTTISLMRKAVGDDPQTQTIIKTYHGHGFRYVAELDTPQVPASQSTDSGKSSPVLSLRERRVVAILCLRLIRNHGGEVTPDQRQTTLEQSYAAAQKTVEQNAIELGPVTALCRSFNRVLCAKGERLWERNVRKNLDRKQFG